MSRQADHSRGSVSSGRLSVVAVGVLMVTMGWTGTLAGQIDVGPTTAMSGHDDGHDHEHVNPLTADAPGAKAAQALVTGEVQVVPEVSDGFALQPLAPSSGATVITFGPGQDLFAATAGGQILRYSTIWSQVGPVVQDVEVFATGFTLPQGLAFDDEGTMYVSDVRENETTSTDENAAGRPLGRVTQIDAVSGDRDIIVDGLPNGQHNTNHIRFGPDGLLYLPNGNPNDHGNDTGTGQSDIFPYSGAFLAVDVNGVDDELPDTTPDDPAILNWRDSNGDRIADDDIVDHERNAGFAEQVQVFAHGFRNIYDIAFAPDHLPYAGAAFTGQNGPQPPAEAQDVFYKIEAGSHHGFPFCFDRGDPGATGEEISKEANPASPNPQVTCGDKPTADAMLGWHVCATGLDFPPEESSVPVDATFPEAMRSSAYLGECGPQQVDSIANQTVNDQATTHNTGHKVARLALDDTGEPTSVNDFVTGLQSPTDVQFGPDGAMYISDVDVIYRVSPTETPESPDATVPIAAVGQSFVPAMVVVPEGTTVQWIGDILPHTVTTSDELCKPHVENEACNPNEDGDPNSFDKSLGSSPANSVSHTFTEEGVYPYYCKIHYQIGMVGMVMVVDPDDPGGLTVEDIREAIGVGGY